MHSLKLSRFLQPALRRALPRVLGGALLWAMLGCVSEGWAQAWPTKQAIKLVAVFPQGGSVDQVARIIAPPLSKLLKQHVIVENRGGSSGTIGASAVAHAPADGYTFAVVFDTYGVNPSLSATMPFDSKKDLTPLVLVGTSSMVLATHVNSEFKTFADVMSAAKAQRNVSFGTIANGSLGHLAMVLLSRDTGAQWTHVPYKGGGPLMSDAVAGRVPLSIASVFVTKPNIDSHRLRPLAVTTSQRAAELPDVPTIQENGYPGFEALAWWAFLAPAKTPPDIMARMNEALNQVLRHPVVSKKLQAQGIVLGGGSVAEATQFIHKQIDVWAKVVKDNDIRAD
jgi:tripartite-type tricarboxylate transporter receptor subunit TctC